MDGKIVFEGKTPQGVSVTIRYPTKDDAKAMWTYINTLSKEQTFIAFQGEEISLEDEIKYVELEIEKIHKKTAVQLLVFSNENLIGISAIDLNSRIAKHEGIFGISIAKDYRGKGVGKLFMETVLKEAEKQLPDLRVITLGVFPNNPIAVSMYEKFGFKEYGRLPEGILYKGEYLDHIYMWKKIR